MKKQRMNKTQENYLVSKAMWDAANKVQKERFNEFLQNKGITEDDLDDDNFETLSAEYDIFAKAEIENSKLAWENLKLAEAALIEFGISIAPAKIRETLRNGLKLSVTKRKEIIEMLVKLDVSTLPKGAAA